MKRLLINCALASLILLATGCESAVTVVNSDSDIVRLGPDVSGHVYTIDAKGNWVLSRNRVALPQGWYAGAYHPK